MAFKHGVGRSFERVQMVPLGGAISCEAQRVRRNVGLFERVQMDNAPTRGLTNFRRAFKWPPLAAPFERVQTGPPLWSPLLIITMHAGGLVMSPPK